MGSSALGLSWPDRQRGDAVGAALELEPDAGGLGSGQGDGGRRARMCQADQSDPCRDTGCDHADGGVDLDEIAVEQVGRRGRGRQAGDRILLHRTQGPKREWLVKGSPTLNVGSIRRFVRLGDAVPDAWFGHDQTAGTAGRIGRVQLRRSRLT